MAFEFKEGSKEYINQQFQNNIEFFRFEFNEPAHMIQDEEKRNLLLKKWKLNELVNPLTNRSIKQYSSSWRKLARLTGMIMKASDFGTDRFEVRLVNKEK